MARHLGHLTKTKSKSVRIRSSSSRRMGKTYTYPELLEKFFPDDAQVHEVNRGPKVKTLVRSARTDFFKRLSWSDTWPADEEESLLDK